MICSTLIQVVFEGSLKKRGFSHPKSNLGTPLFFFSGWFTAIFVGKRFWISKNITSKQKCRCSNQQPGSEDSAHWPQHLLWQRWGRLLGIFAGEEKTDLESVVAKNLCMTNAWLLDIAGHSQPCLNRNLIYHTLLIISIISLVVCKKGSRAASNRSNPRETSCWVWRPA